ncbi:MAG: hypothetical protein PWP24_476 [Clostridiales bacterium]|nr:hypothetical protein [Clostridiales bacterium]
MIQKIQAEIENSVKVMQHVNTSVQEGEGIISEASQAFQNIYDNIEQVSVGLMELSVSIEHTFSN